MATTAAKKSTKAPEKASEKPSKAASGSTGKSGASQAKGAGKPRQRANALQAPLQPSEELAAVVGKDALPRTEVVSKVWAYIKANNLQNPENRREILADDNLKKVFGKDRVTMFEMNRYLAQHLK